MLQLIQLFDNKRKSHPPKIWADGLSSGAPPIDERCSYNSLSWYL